MQEFQPLNFSQRIPESWNYSGCAGHFQPVFMDISRLFLPFLKLQVLQAGIRNIKNTDCGPGNVLCKLRIERKKMQDQKLGKMQD